jgi:hypothetical protein
MLGLGYLPVPFRLLCLGVIESSEISLGSFEGSVIELSAIEDAFPSFNPESFDPRRYLVPCLHYQ